MKTITIEVPDDCDVRVVKKKRKEKPTIETYQDLIDNNIEINGYYINELSEILHDMDLSKDDNYFKRNIAASEKVAKSMLAMAMISQLMPYYGGEITDEEWQTDIYKYVIEADKYKNIIINAYKNIYYFLAFHTSQQRDEFLKHNERLIKDYLMID